MKDDDRVRPKKVRLSGLQDVQVEAFVRVDQRCAEQYWELGFDAAEVPVRGHKDVYKLPKDHAVRVAEADYVVAGFSAWRDEAPGVAYLEDLSVDPDYQRFGIGTQLLGRVFEEARDKGFNELVLRTWDKATWAREFYAKLGFKSIDDAAPTKVREWLAAKTDGGRPFLRPGESALWAAIPKPPKDEDEIDDEGAGEDG